MRIKPLPLGLSLFALIVLLAGLAVYVLDPEFSITAKLEGEAISKGTVLVAAIERYKVAHSGQLPISLADVLTTPEEHAALDLSFPLREWRYQPGKEVPHNGKYLLRAPVTRGGYPCVIYQSESRSWSVDQ